MSVSSGSESEAAGESETSDRQGSDSHENNKGSVFAEQDVALAAYAPILDQYAKAVRGMRADAKAIPDVNTNLLRSIEYEGEGGSGRSGETMAGFVLDDINDDGVSELIIGAEAASGPIFWDLYTLAGHKPVRPTAIGYDTCGEVQGLLLEDGTIMVCGASALELDEMLMSYLQSQGDAYGFLPPEAGDNYYQVKDGKLAESDTPTYIFMIRDRQKLVFD